MVRQRGDRREVYTKKEAVVNEGTVSRVFKTKSVIARDHIVNLILSGEVKPGDRITTREISFALGMSETPIREAISSLATEGWLDVQSHIGATVASIRPEEIDEIGALRGIVCGLAIELGGPTYDEQRLADIDENLERAAVAIGSGDYPQYAALNNEFHKLLCDTPNSQWCLRILVNMLGLMSFQRHGISPGIKRFMDALDEHRRIRDLIRVRDFSGAASLVKQHEHNAGVTLARALNYLQVSPRETSGESS